MSRIWIPTLFLGASVLLAGCGGEDVSDDSEMRDLSLAPAESIAALDDQPLNQPAEQPGRQATSPSPTTPPPTPATPPPAPRPQPKPAPQSLPVGTEFALTAQDSISNRTNVVGDPVRAVSAQDVVDASGKVVIPAGAEFEGVITAIQEAENPGDAGTLAIAFNQVRFGGKTYAIDAMSDSLATERQGRGITGGDAAKVGVGAAAGAVLGGLITKDTKGAIVGGVVGAAAGAGVAGATKDADILLPAGALVRIVLNSPMVLEPVS
jgi:hypothetical protein